MSSPTTTTTDETRLLAVIRSLQPLLNAATPRSAPTARADDDASSVTLVAGSVSVTVNAHMLAQMDALAALGRLAATATAALATRRSELHEAAIDARRAATLDALEIPTPDQFGLTDAGGPWALPGVDGVHVTPVLPRPDSGWGGSAVACRLRVHTAAGVLLGTITITADWDVTTVGAHAHTILDESVIGSARRRELVTTRPWDNITLPTDGAVADHVRALAAVADDVTPWVQDVDAAMALVRDTQETRAQETADWLKLSRSKDRIPTAPLTAWMRANSHIDYSRSGFAESGVRVVAQQIVGKTRPRHLDPDTYGRRGSGRRTNRGVAEVLYVARIVHESVRHRDGTSFYSFLPHQIDALREALPQCVIRVPEDRKAIFVAFDSPEHVAELEAALVEWVLVGPGSSTD